jgi:DNA-binding transcriptional ArsR family regulator
VAESEELLRGVKQIEAVQSYHSHVLELLLKVQDHERLRDEIVPVMSKRDVFAVYAAVDGASSGVEIAGLTKVPQPSVSNHLRTLEGLGLIQVTDVSNAKIYAKTPMYQLLQIEKHLPKELVDTIAPRRKRRRTS